MTFIYCHYLETFLSLFTRPLIWFLTWSKKSSHICLGLKGLSLAHLLNVLGDAEMGCTFDFLYGPFLKWFELDISNSGDGESFLLLFECWGRFWCVEVDIPAYIFDLIFTKYRYELKNTQIHISTHRVSSRSDIRSILSSFTVA